MADIIDQGLAAVNKVAAYVTNQTHQLEVDRQYKTRGEKLDEKLKELRKSNENAIKERDAVLQKVYATESAINEYHNKEAEIAKLEEEIKQHSQEKIDADKRLEQVINDYYVIVEGPKDAAEAAAQNITQFVSSPTNETEVSMSGVASKSAPDHSDAEHHN